MEDVGIFLAIWFILWQFGICVGHFGIFSRFGILCQEKSGNPISEQRFFLHLFGENLILAVIKNLIFPRGNPTYSEFTTTSQC
jgi:hypothetical protein